MHADAFELEGNSNAIRACRMCGCTESHACPGGCYWVDSDLCSACAGDRNIHDPIENPQPGDVLAVGNDVREVLQVANGSVEYGFPGKAATRWLHAILWQLWARNAEVRRVAQ